MTSNTVSAAELRAAQWIKIPAGLLAPAYNLTNHVHVDLYAGHVELIDTMINLDQDGEDYSLMPFIGLPVTLTPPPPLGWVCLQRRSALGTILQAVGYGPPVEGEWPVYSRWRDTNNRTETQIATTRASNQPPHYCQSLLLRRQSTERGHNYRRVASLGQQPATCRGFPYAALAPCLQWIGQDCPEHALDWLRVDVSDSLEDGDGTLTWRLQPWLLHPTQSHWRGILVSSYYPARAVTNGMWRDRQPRPGRRP